MKNVLIACEESQTACIEFRKRGFNAFSCDIQPCSGGHPEWHYCGDVIDLMNRNVRFQTYDGENEYINFVPKWDLIIAHPPCTFLTAASAVELSKHPERYEKGLEAKEFFMMFYNWNECPVAIENPAPLKRFNIPKYNQICYPWQFGEEYNKRVCLWLKGLPKLKPTKIVNKGDMCVWYDKNGKRHSMSKWYNVGAKDDCSKIRSKSFKGIAEAMAEQWGDYINECT